MKKVKLTTATLAILAGSVVAPLVSNATETNGNAAVQTTEVAKDEKDTKDTKDEKGTVASEAKDKDNTEVKPVEETKKDDQKVESKETQSTGNVADRYIKEVQALPYLTKEQKADYISQLNNAGQDATVLEGIVAKAKAENDKILADSNNLAVKQVEARKQIEKAYDAFEITTEQKTAFDKKIDNAKTVEEVNAILAELQETTTSNKALKDAKKTAQAAVDKAYKAKLIDINAKGAYETRLAKATTVAEANAVESEVNAIIALDAAKKEAKDKAYNLFKENKISANQLSDVQLAIDKATTIDEVNAALAKTELVIAKNEAIVKVSKLVDGDDLAAANEGITKATTIDEVNGIVAFVEAKVEAKKVVANELSMHRITDSEATNYYALINEAKDVTELNAIAKDATQLYETRKAALAEVAKYAEEGKITKSAKKLYDSALNAAKTTKEVNDIMTELRADLGVSIPWTPLEPSKPAGKDEVPMTPLEPSKPAGKDEVPMTPLKPSKPTENKKDDETDVKKDTTKKVEAKKVVAKKAEAKKVEAKKLPQTNDTVNAGLVAGGLMSVLTAAFLFFRKGK